MRSSELVGLFVSDEDFGERNVSVILDDVESEMIFIDHTNGEMSVRIVAETMIHKSLSIYRVTQHLVPKLPLTLL